MMTTESGKISHEMTPKMMDAFLKHEEQKGMSENMLRRFRCTLRAVYDSLPADKLITKERLTEWRKSMEREGMAQATVQNYAKHINRYLDFAGCSEMRFRQGKAKDLTGMVFGYLKAIRPTEKKFRNNIVWLCECKCGKTVEVPSTSLLTGNTLSCGCLQGEHLHRVNQFIDGTSLRRTLKDETLSKHAVSGYVGVTPKRDKWSAYIKYKGVMHFLGCYSDINDAVKARARAKELVMEDARGLLDFYREVQREFPQPMDRKAAVPELPKETAAKCADSPVRRRDNTSGHVGVSFRNNRWEARISHNGVRYTVGRFAEIADAIDAREAASALLKQNPQSFVERYTMNH